MSRMRNFGFFLLSLLYIGCGADDEVINESIKKDSSIIPTAITEYGFVLVVSGIYTIILLTGMYLMFYLKKHVFGYYKWQQTFFSTDDVIKFEFIGLTEIVLSITMIIFLVTKPKGLFPFLEIGEIIKKKFFKKE